jgi:hypothetical protein
MSEMTYIDVLSQKFIRDAVLVNDIIVHAGAGGRRSEEEAEQSATTLLATARFCTIASHVPPSAPRSLITRKTWTHPPLKAPTGFLIGAAATTSTRLTALVWKERVGAKVRYAVRTAGVRIREAIAPMVCDGS